MEIKIGLSARHVHLTKEDYKILFGNEKLTKLKDLTQIGEYASTSVVSLVSNKGTIENVRILGPLRSYTQVEISKTDSYVLGINPPVRNSGDLLGSEVITIKNNDKSITKPCCIIANRHIHINTKDLDKYNLKNGEVVKLKINGVKGGILNNVIIKSADSYVFEAHLDLDDGNAHLIKNGDIGEIINE